MPITVKRYDTHNRIILWQVGSRWDLTDYYTAMQDTASLVSAHFPQRADVLIDMQHTLIFPSNVIQAIIQQHYDGNFQQNYGVTVIVSTAPIVRSLFSIFSASPFTRDRILLTSTVEKGVEVIQRRRLADGRGSSGGGSATGTSMARSQLSIGQTDSRASASVGGLPQCC
ncbi:MAG: hypothetical protein AAFV33_17790 [Chloroflexota bacterium]